MQPRRTSGPRSPTSRRPGLKGGSRSGNEPARDPYASAGHPHRGSRPLSHAAVPPPCRGGRRHQGPPRTAGTRQALRTPRSGPFSERARRQAHRPPPACSTEAGVALTARTGRATTTLDRPNGRADPHRNRGAQRAHARNHACCTRWRAAGCRREAPANEKKMTGCANFVKTL